MVEVTDFFPHLIRTYPGINDLPTEPTAQKAGNGSHLISQHNNFLETTRIAVNNLEEKVAGIPSGTIRIVYADEPVVAGDKVVVANYSGRNIALSVPSGGVPVGGEITMMHVFPGRTVRIVPAADSPYFKYKGRDVTEVSFTAAYEFVSLIYVGFENETYTFAGWIPNKDSLFTSIEYIPPSV